MIAFRRKIESEVIANKNDWCCQAAFNSDGCITLRLYDKNSSCMTPEDTILVLSKNETSAIVKLLKELKSFPNIDDLPF